MAYIYDPSQQISQSLGKTAAGIGNIFSQVIAQKQQDFTLAQEAEANIQALKKNLNQFSQENITNKSNALLEETRSSIFKNGKLDYSKLREIRNKISDISDLKQGYEYASKEFERRLQLGISTKDDIVSFTKYYSDLTKKLSNEDLIKNPQDLSVQLDDVYYDNLDANKVLKRKISSYLSTSKRTQEFTGADKSLKVASVDTYDVMKMDASGKLVIDEDKLKASGVDLKAVYNDMVQSDPAVKKLIDRFGGVGASFIKESGEDNLIRSLINMTAGTASVETKRSAEQIRGDELRVESLEQTIEQNRKLFPLKIEEVNQSIAVKKAQAEKLKSAGALNLPPEQVGVNVDSKIFYFPKSQQIKYQGKDAVVSAYKKNKDGSISAIIHKDNFSIAPDGTIITKGEGVQVNLDKDIQVQVSGKYNSLDPNNEALMVFRTGLQYFSLLPANEVESAKFNPFYQIPNIDDQLKGDVVDSATPKSESTRVPVGNFMKK